MMIKVTFTETREYTANLMVEDDFDPDGMSDLDAIEFINNLELAMASERLVARKRKLKNIKLDMGTIRPIQDEPTDGPHQVVEHGVEYHLHDKAKLHRCSVLGCVICAIGSKIPPTSVVLQHGMSARELVARNPELASHFSSEELDEDESSAFVDDKTVRQRRNQTIVDSVKPPKGKP